MRTKHRSFRDALKHIFMLTIHMYMHYWVFSWSVFIISVKIGKCFLQCLTSRLCRPSLRNVETDCTVIVKKYRFRIKHYLESIFKLV